MDCTAIEHFRDPSWFTAWSYDPAIIFSLVSQLALPKIIDSNIVKNNILKKITISVFKLYSSSLSTTIYVCMYYLIVLDIKMKLTEKFRNLMQMQPSKNNVIGQEKLAW